MSELFLTLIHPFPIQKKSVLQRSDLAEIKSLGITHNLFQLVCSQLKKYELLFTPQELVKDFLEESKGLYLKNIVRSMQQEAVEREVITLLRKKGIPSVVIKGNALATEIYNDPNCRACCDIDILIKSSDIPRVDSILTEAGYTRNDEISLKFWVHRLHHAIYYHPVSNDIIEVHWNFGIPSFFRLSSEDIWNEVVHEEPVKLRLTPELLIIMLLMHHHMHSFRELRILVDILWSLYKYEETINWHLFVSKMRKAGLIKTTLISLYQIQSVWEEASKEIKSIQMLQEETKNKGFRIPKYLTSSSKMNIYSENTPNIYRDKIITRLALDRWSTILFSYFKTLFPVPEAIKELYGDKRKWMLPFNYLRFIKWRVKEWASR